MGLVEALGVGLRVQHQHAVAIAVALADQGVEQLAAHAQAARALVHGHAADVAVGQQAAGAQRRAVGGVGHGMHRDRVVVVHLDLGRHLLLDHEHVVAHR